MNYEEVYRGFSWDKCINEDLDWARAGHYNITHEAIDRHAVDPKKVAFFYVSDDGREEKYTYREMKNLTAKFANVLKKLGVQKGDRVARMLPKTMENYITFLGTWKAGAVDVPVFTAYGPEAVEFRVKNSEAKVLVTDAENRPKVEKIAGGLPGVKILVVAKAQGMGILPGDYSFWQEMSTASREFETAKMKADDLVVIHYTSGTTGKPKGCIVTEKGMMYVLPLIRYSLDIRQDDMFWGFADPGWIYALFTVGTSVLIGGGSLLIYNGRLDAQQWYEVMDKYEVTNFAAAATMYRMIMAAGDGLSKRYKVKARRYTSAGDYLNPEVSIWFKEHLNAGISDQYGLTEVGIVVGNYPFMPEKPGSMGRPLPGFDVKVVDEEGKELPRGETGIVAVKYNNYFLGSGYWKETEKWKSCFIKDDLYNTGDMAVVDKDGYFFYRGRNDDVIKSSGYRIGPAEVEAAVAKHPAVAEAAVVGKPDPEKVEIVKAYVVLKPEYEPSDALAKEIQSMVKNRYAAHLYPREIEFMTQLPKTESGKIMRRVLRQRAKEETKA